MLEIETLDVGRPVPPPGGGSAGSPDGDVPQEKLRIPELPPTSADFDSFIGEVATEDIPVKELDYRLNARDGYARPRPGSASYIIQSGDGDLQDYDRPYDQSGFTTLREERTLTGEQRDVVKKVIESTEKNKAAEKQLQSTASFLEDVLAGEIPAKELDYRLNARDGYARPRPGSASYIIQSGDGDLQDYSRPYDQSGYTTLREEREISNAQRELVKSVTERLEIFNKSAEGLQSTASFLEDVLAGEIPAKELDYRLNARDGYARPRPGSASYIIQSGDGDLQDYSRPYDQSGYTTLREERTLTPEQREVVRYIQKEVEARAPKANASRADATAGQAVRERMSLTELGEEIKRQGYDDETARDLLSLVTLQGSVNDEKADKAVEALFTTGDDTRVIELLDDRRMEFADISDSSDVRGDLNNLETYLQTARRVSLRSRFWQTVGGKDGVNGALRRLEEYESVDDADRLLALDLGRQALGIRRDNFIVDAFREISGDKPDFQAASLLLGGAAKIAEDIKDEQGLKILEYVVDTAYTGEVNNYFMSLTKDLTLDRARIAEVVERLQSAPVRPAITGVNFFDKFQKAKEQFLGITERLDAFAFDKELVELRKRFGKDPDVEGLVRQIVELPGETPEDGMLRQSLLDELALTVSVRRGLNPGQYDELRTIEIEGIRADRKPGGPNIDLAEAVPERNVKAVRMLVENFQRSLMPLFEALRGGDVGGTMMEDYVDGDARGKFVQRIAALREQRQLTDIEQAYLQSVELLTVFNPHLVALAREAPELTSLYLERYFFDMDARTAEGLIEDAYVPVVQIGLGPNGIAAAGELMRVNPELAAQTLYIDSVDLPGGPFGVAKGPSWELNSANSISDSTNNLPDVLDADEKGASVRSYGSPLVAYPGERKEGNDVRTASINVTVDYLLNPDNVSTKRYPTNEDLARVLQLQAAMLIDKVMLSTRLVSVEPVDDGQPGNKRLTLQYDTIEGETITTTVRTDSVIIAGGLGEPSYGIRLEGSKAEKILQGDNISTDNFPLLTDTIGAFAELSDPADEPTAPKGSIVIYGAGNSADVLVEYLGRQFESGNKALNGISKVYVVSTAELSKRPRYARINDLKARNGQSNFLEVVPARVSDIELGKDGKLRLLDENGKPIIGGTNGTRGEIRADHVIAATGFRPILDQVFADSLSEGESLDRRQGLGRVSLPSNPGFSIADELINDPDVLIVGTASRADFQNPGKLAQLPDESREALLRNGAENAVAIGFRTPDTRAAVRLKFSGKTAEKPADIEAPSGTMLVDTERLQADERAASVPFVGTEALPATRRDVEADSDTLSALFLQSLPQLVLARGNNPINPGSDRANPRFSFQINYDEGEARFRIAPGKRVSLDLLRAVEQAVSDPYFQAYALKALRGRRVNRGLEVSLAFNRGRLQYRDPGNAEGKGRTYVEVL